MKYALMAANQENALSVTRLAGLLSVSCSGYYAWRKRSPSKREVAQRELDKQIKVVYWQHRGRYGYRRIYAELSAVQGYGGSRNRIHRRMKAMGLKAITKRRFKHTTDSLHSKPIAPNLLNQLFDMQRPDQAWVGDITYIRVGQRKWLYLAVVIDCYSRRVVGWAMSKRMKASLVSDALEMALHNRHTPKGVIVHSDRGSQYCSKRYQKLIKRHQLKCSMSGKGNCYDNAVAESFFHSLKTEHVYHCSYQTHEQARRSLFWYIEAYYNRSRRHSTIGYKSPVEYETITQQNRAA